MIILSVVAIFIGAIDLSTFSVDGFGKLDLIIISRLSRLLAILCTGVGMSVSGLIMQQLCMNKFVSPTTGATISSAQFGVLLSLVFFSQATLFQKTMLAFITSIIGTWIFVWMIQRIKFKDVMLVPLIGIMFGMVISGFTNFFAYRYGAMQSLSATLVGDFSLIIKGRYEIVFLVVPLVVLAYIYANHFNIVGMGEDFASNLGISYNLVLIMGLSIAALITASVVVTVGTISYIGLIVPNIVAMFRGDWLIERALRMKKIGILGCGRLATIVAHGIKSGAVENVELECIFARSREKGEKLGAEVGCNVAASLEEFMQYKLDYVIEAASKEAVREHTHKILLGGANIIILTTGPFGEQEFYDKIKECAIKSKRKVHLASGVVGGFDIMSTAKLMGDMSAEFSCYRKGITTEMEFLGNAKELYAQHQNHLNVAISVALGSSGVELTKANIQAVEDGKRSSFETKIEGNFGKACIHTELGEGGPAMAAWSAISTLQRILEPISF